MNRNFQLSKHLKTAEELLFSPLTVLIFLQRHMCIELLSEMWIRKFQQDIDDNYSFFFYWELGRQNLKLGKSFLITSQKYLYSLTRTRKFFFEFIFSTRNCSISTYIVWLNSFLFVKTCNLLCHKSKISVCRLILIHRWQCNSQCTVGDFPLGFYRLRGVASKLLQFVWSEEGTCFID